MARLSSAAQKTLQRIVALIEDRKKRIISWRQRDRSLQPLIAELAKSGIDPDILLRHVPGWVVREVRWAKTGGLSKALKASSAKP